MQTRDEGFETYIREALDPISSDRSGRSDSGQKRSPVKGFLDSRAVLLALFEFRPENNWWGFAIDVCKNVDAPRRSPPVVT